jgi:hypothetical protein
MDVFFQEHLRRINKAAVGPYASLKAKMGWHATTSDGCWEIRDCFRHFSTSLAGKSNSKAKLPRRAQKSAALPEAETLELALEFGPA